MAKKPKKAAPEGEEGAEGEAPKSGKKKLIVIGAVVLALAGGGGFFFLKKKAGGDGHGQDDRARVRLRGRHRPTVDLQAVQPHRAACGVSPLSGFHRSLAPLG